MLTQEDFRVIQALAKRGVYQNDIAAELGVHPKTVSRALKRGAAPKMQRAPRPSKLDPFKPYLDEHAGDGHGSFTRLFREIRDLGYDGSYSVVRNYLDQVRPAKAPLPEAPPTVRDVTNWLTRHPDSLTEDEKPRLKAILGRCPEL